MRSSSEAIAFEATGEDFGRAPVCAGPFSFVERIQQDRIVLEKFEDYYRADEINFDTVTFLPIPDTTVRLANLRAGDPDSALRDALFLAQMQRLGSEERTWLAAMLLILAQSCGPAPDFNPPPVVIVALDGAPDPAQAPKVPDWHDASAPLDARARAWLAGSSTCTTSPVSTITSPPSTITARRSTRSTRGGRG
mgnify:CR=1 FL=1